MSFRVISGGTNRDSVGSRRIYGCDIRPTLEIIVVDSNFIGVNMAFYVDAGHRSFINGVESNGEVLSGEGFTIFTTRVNINVPTPTEILPLSIIDFDGIIPKYGAPRRRFGI
ncbi:hypothetical protein SDC9_95116 [bioreactor metagenome]|uniref:Uncharacterized protein n=1 Tax=bioreactor metagenome TaxID=1076179 RepID=A0A645A7Y1_9ZZZZ